MDNAPRARPFDYSIPSKSFKNYFLKPVEVMDEWIRVDILDNNFEKKSDGWIRWRQGNRLLITYNLLS